MRGRSRRSILLEGRASVHEAIVSPETTYAKAKTAGWLLKILEQNIALESSFFDCLRWVTGDLRRPLQAVMQEAQKTARKSGIVAAREAIKESMQRPQGRLASEFEDLYEEHPCLEGIIRDVVRQECCAGQIPHDHSAAPYIVASKRLKQTFGLNNDCLMLCEFIFINQNFSAVENYFENFIEIYKYENRRILAYILDINPSLMQKCTSELFSCGLFDIEYGDCLRLKDCLLSFWDLGCAGVNELFSRPLSGEALPLEAFHIPSDDVTHVKKLLKQKSDAPVHILLYGSPGTGKSSFAHSLARSCGVKAWAVLSREDDDDDDRRASLTASLHMAARHNGAFVLVDEAERLLDTDRYFGRQTKDKAWLNDFLERPGQRIIWITNQVEHIDPAVRRRFSFSIHFEKLGVRERIDIWRQILTQHHVMQYVNDDQVNMLARNYPVEAADINSAVVQAQNIYKEPNAFVSGLERVLHARVVLQRNGTPPRIKTRAASDFTLDGVTLEGSPADLLEKCRRVDAAMRGGSVVRPGCGTMLFYGPPGTGKTALARYIAQELDRECVVKRASDLLSPYVGVAEQQIAEAFREAEHNGAVLVIDEADTFLYSRDAAQRSWETSLVNECLTALEECRCFCICTTNRRNELDAAVMRRFSHKIAFTYAGREQVLALYASLLSFMCAEPLPSEQETRLLRLNRLTPGDFYTVRSQYDPLFVDTSKISHTLLVDALIKEQALKKLDSETRRMGFVH